MQAQTFKVRVDALREEAHGVRSFSISRLDGMPFDAYEPTSSVGADERILAVASTPDAQHDVLVASRFGKGVVVRLGVPDFSARLSTDPELVTLLKRTWTLLRFR